LQDEFRKTTEHPASDIQGDFEFLHKPQTAQKTQVK
jgi:hypothetical protein